MSLYNNQKSTNINIQEKANLIWNIATHLVGLFKPHEYGKVILPMTIVKWFDETLKDTKNKVLLKNDELVKLGVIPEIKDKMLKNTSGFEFYNTSKFNLETLCADPDNIQSNFESYLQGYSDNVIDILSYFKFDDQIKTLAENNKLYIVISDFNSKNADMKNIASLDMGYVFEELIRKFSESYDEQAGAHFTARDIIYLMTELLVVPEKDEIVKNGCTKTAYDMAMGTSQMLGCLNEKLQDINLNSSLTCYGQEFNPETYAIAKADMLIKGGNASGMKFGDTLDNDQFSGYEFDYIISNPPFGIDWESEMPKVKDEKEKLGFDGRFGPGLPPKSDGQLLFMLNGIKKLKDTGRMAIIQNGSSLFTGDASSGPSEIRRYIIEEDMLEAIIQLPNDLFYNTGIATYIWVVTKSKEQSRIGKVQLIDASKCYQKRRKNIGNKRVDLSDKCIELIMKAYNNYTNEELKDTLDNNEEIMVESKVFDNEYFGYTKVVVETSQVDEKGNKVLKKGKPVAEKGKSDSEIIPLQEDIESYFNKSVLPYNSSAFMDRTKDKVGYEVPFTRIFYKFVEPRKSEDIFEEFKQLSIEEQELMKKILGE